jgi:transcriptional regulator with XRE-family HTH domain
MLQVLVSARKDSGLTQVQLAERLGKPQPFVSYIESGERRIDVIEFCAIARSMGYDPEKLFSRVVEVLPDRLDI